MAEIDRSAIGRAKFFMELARECKVHEMNEFEAYLEASIIFTRAAILRVQAANKKHLNYESWWEGLLDNPSVMFIGKQRNLIAHEAPPNLGQIASLDSTDPATHASQLRFYERSEDGKPINAITTLSRHISEAENVVFRSEETFR